MPDELFLEKAKQGMEYVDIFSQGLAVVFATVRVEESRSNLILLPQCVSGYEIGVWSLAQSRGNLCCSGSFTVTLNRTEHACLRVCQWVFA